MSVEAFVLAALIEDGNLKKAFQAGVTDEDFQLYDEEWHWLCRQAEQKKAINLRRFKQSFPEFEAIQVNERTQDLIEELKQERAFVDLQAAVEETLDALDQENAIDKAGQLRERLTEILRVHAPTSDVLIKSDWPSQMEHMKKLRTLRETGEVLGISTGFKNLDHHWGGMLPGRLTTVLGRPGDGKSFFLTKLEAEALLEGRRVGVFSPEMDRHAHTCRIHTLLSNEEGIQRDVGLRHSFRNRALMEGHGFNIKTYKKFCQYLESELKGEIILFTQKWRLTKMTPSFIESKIDDLGLEMIVIDPIYKLKSQRRRQLKHEEIADLVDALQDMAQAFQIPVIVSNQAHRQMGNRGDAPHKDASFGSDAPAHESDHVIGVKYFEDESKVVLRCTKNRYGQNFRVDVRFRPNIGVMEDITPLRGSYFNGSEDSPEDVEAARKEIEEANRQEVESD
jgi:replicative DNA helicase